MKNYQKKCKESKYATFMHDKIVYKDQTVENAIWANLNIHLEFEFGIIFQKYFN